MKALKILGVILGWLVVIIIMGLMTIGFIAPETSVYLGHAVPRKYIKEIRTLELLEKEEKIIYFYTDALFDIKEGFYFVTDEHLVLYSQEWEEPKTIIDYKSITDIEVEYDDSFLDDSYVMVETTSGMSVSFPLSSEKGGDKKFVQHIKAKMAE